jgi:2-polyprenyl-6-methoxyphenol hydroxylase-like FAD-dependent oxidoreductase
MPDILYTDVLVVGAGPVGTLIGLGLARQGHNAVIIGMFTLHSQPTRWLGRY